MNDRDDALTLEMSYWSSNAFTLTFADCTAQRVVLAVVANRVMYLDAVRSDGQREARGACGGSSGEI